MDSTWLEADIKQVLTAKPSLKARLRRDAAMFYKRMRLASIRRPRQSNDWGAAYGSRFTFVGAYLPAYPGRSVGVNVCIRDLSDFSVSLRWTMDTHYPLISWRPCKLFANHWQILSWTI